MSKVFRLYNIQGNPNIVDWQDANVYGVQAISEITDPDGADAKKEITSIPSPFARIDLIKTAFREVVNMANRDSKGRGYAGLDGKTIYHKMVSDAFDIAQIFFNIDTFKDKFEILVWDRSKDLKVNNVLGKTLKRYLESDATGDDPYNFGKLERIYLLNYIGPDRPGNLNIVGATSPATLFFSSANELDYVSKNINFGQDRPFDNEYQPLYKRDFEFQKYIYAFRAAYGIKAFGKHFREIEDYLISSTGKECNYKHLSEDQKRIIDALDENTIAGYEPITVGERGADQLDILGKPFHKKSNIPNWESDFVIDSALYQGEKKPLVLPVESGNTYERLKYTTDIWGRQHKAPYKDNTLWANRRLPIVSEEYPYLTISDFLIDTIVRMPYEINKESFFDGNIDRAGGKSYLLPLTDLFFQFFTTEQLRGNLKDGKKMIELKNNAGGITVVLRIPIKDNKHIEYRRTYFEGVEPDIKNNDGGLVEHDFVYALFPNIRFNSDKEAFYRFGIIPDEFGTNNFTAKYINDNGINTVEYIRNENYKNLLQCKNLILENSNFKFLQITCPDGNSGLVLPKFVDCSGNNAGNEQFTFAIDFGTTNTHIEYSKGNRKPVPFNIQEQDKQIHLMTSTNIGELKRQMYDFDFIPEKINSENQFKFPMRTALSSAKNCKFRNGVLPFVQGNIAFIYEKRRNSQSNQFFTGLKWEQGEELQNYEENKNRVKCFIESLCMIVRHKVLLNNGDLSNTKIVWSYPVSMEGKRLELFEQIWQDVYQKYFGENLNNLISVTESIAPYIYYKEEESAVANMVSIDIGGGTTDMVIVEKEQVKFITSFRFAANAIFGNGYAKNNINGIIQHFKPEIEQVIKEAGLRTVEDINIEIREEKDSANIASFFFSLKNNQDIINADKKENTKITDLLDFQAKLNANSSHKIIFALFYGAIIYHLANIMKSQKLSLPRHIAFSGNGSKIIQILSKKNDVLEDFTKLIFEKVYGESYVGKKLSIIQKENPKEVTCKGAILYSPDDQNYNKLKKVILKGIDNRSVFSSEKYAEIDQNEYLKNTVEEVKQFLRLLLDLLNEYPEFMKKFGISYDSLELVEKECFSDDLITFADKGLNQKLKEVNIKQPIEETFFFYPLVGLLNALSNEIYNTISNSK